jgi:hypothetical protein
VNNQPINFFISHLVKSLHPHTLVTRQQKFMSGKPITFGRYQKVEAILEADRAIKSKLGAKTEIVCRPPPSNEKAYFSKPVVYITETLHASGVDAHTTSKTDVLKLALKLMQEGDGQFKIPDIVRPAAAEPEPVTPSPTPEPKKAKAEKSKPVVAPKPPVKKAASGLARATVPPATVPTAKKSEPKKEGKAAPKSDLAPSRSQPEASERKSPVDPSFPLAYGVSMVTLLYAVDQIAEAHDRSPGRKERQQKVADLIREYQALTVIPKSAKETSPSSE